MLEQRDDVAVIVPNYNKKKTIRACLDSVFAQTYRPAEVIVVDDASTDGSREMAEQYACRILRLAGNTGAAGARNAGVADSTAPLVFFLDSDTALAPDAIENAVRAYRETPDCAMVQGIYDVDPLYDDGLVEAYRVAFEHFDRRQSTATFLSNTLIARSVFDEAGGLDERLRDGEDFEFGSRVPSRYRLVVTDQVVTRADDEDTFWGCLGERFWRASTLPVILSRTRRLPRDREIGFRIDMIGPEKHTRRRPPLLAAVLAALILVSLPVAVVQPWALVATAGLGAAFIAVNRPFLAFARQHRGTGFMLFVLWMQFCYLIAFFFGAGFGILRVARAASLGQLNPVMVGVRR